MMLEYKTRSELVKAAEEDLLRFKKGIKTGFWVDMGYTEEELENTLVMCEKWVLYLKHECSWTEYHIAYSKAQRKGGNFING